MINELKCKCQHCSQPIVFPSEMAGQSVECPGCKIETILLVPPAPPKSTPIKDFISGKKSKSSKTLAQIRNQTNYKTLRILINIVQLIFFIAAGAGILYPIGIYFYWIIIDGWQWPDGIQISTTIMMIILASILIILGIAWKQAALLLVDIADCQIQQTGKIIENVD